MSGSSFLGLDAVSLRYGGGDPVFENVSLHLTPGWYGVVGPNGSGKSTLLSLLQGDLPPSEGVVRRQAAPVQLCAQRVEVAGEAVWSMAWAWDKLAGKLRSRLGLDPEELERWPTMSPGERKRWQVAAALWHEPAVLLLDEPTNHLDLQARRLLVEALADFAGIGVVVSHDRAFLESLASKTIWVEAGTVELVDGAFGEARELRVEARRQRTREQEDRRQAQKRAARLFVHERERLQQAARARRSGARMKNAQDRDARSASAKSRTAKAEAAIARRVKAFASRVDRADRALASSAMTRERGGRIRYEGTTAPKEHLLVLDGVDLTAGDRHLAAGMVATLRREDRVHLRGANGAGKSTLLRLLRRRLADGQVLLLPQELTESDCAELLRELREAPPHERGRWLQLADRLGADPERLLRTGRASPGEARKVLLARGLVQRVWCLLLDEPSNHFDLPAIERLEEALSAYEGALVLISHDEALAGRCTNRVWALEGGRLHVD